MFPVIVRFPEALSKLSGEVPEYKVPFEKYRV
jgi:hypothetical protein